ncbi:hypothetical protein [Desulfogranum japonicum]|uniref:hypothetical protein n=1 Tax=Desulfogranum japonicum TaxID=231447 RepID=UPI00048E3EE4|nr:hypothetical protein [Desulfogranum japonicum]
MTISTTSATAGLFSASSPTRKKAEPIENFGTILQKTVIEQQKMAPSKDSTPSVNSDASSIQNDVEGVDAEANTVMTQAEQEPTSVLIDGITVITTGHSLDRREGISLLETVSATESQSIFSQLAAFAQTYEPGAKVSGDDPGSVQNAPGMTVIESIALGPLPAGATSSYMDIDLFTPAGQWTEDTLSRPTTEGSDDDYYRRKTEEYMAVVDVERQLKESYGNDVKLVYSHTDHSYIMLTPDDARYGEMNSAESAVQTIISEVHKGFINSDAVGDILAKYGYNV